jgi:hypothetical protein
LLAGAWAELETAAASLKKLGVQMGSSRYEREGHFSSSTAGSTDWPAALLQAAGDDQVAPVAARRAQALLGSAPSLDAVDVRVVSRLAKRMGWETVRFFCVEGGPKETARWGATSQGHHVWRTDGGKVSLSAQPLLWRILETLTRHGGAATKRQLVEEAWQQGQYHPLRDDNKVQASIRKLRTLLEEDLTSPRCLVTTAEGYALGARCFWWDK